MERNVLHDAVQKITEIRHKQKIAVIVIYVGITLSMLGSLLVNSIMMLGYLIVLGLPISLVGGGVWLHYSVQKTTITKKLKTYLAMKELKTRSGENEDWELTQELLSS